MIATCLVSSKPNPLITHYSRFWVNILVIFNNDIGLIDLLADDEITSSLMDEKKHLSIHICAVIDIVRL